MASSDERREVAARLRGLDSEITSCDTLERAVDKFMKAVCGERPFSPVRYSVRNLCGLGCVLADLIDLPTCQMESIPESSYRVCSRCGAFVRRDAATDCTEAIPVRFCPNCGARVAEGEW